MPEEYMRIKVTQYMKILRKATGVNISTPKKHGELRMALHDVIDEVLFEELMESGKIDEAIKKTLIRK